MTIKSRIAKWLAPELAAHFVSKKLEFIDMKEMDTVRHMTIGGEFKVIQVNSTRARVSDSTGKIRSFRRHLLRVVSRPTQKGEPMVRGKS